MLSGSVPIPLSLSAARGYTGFYAPAPLAPGSPPAPSPNAIVGGQGAFAGYTLMLNADIDPLGGGGGGGPPAAIQGPPAGSGPAPVTPAGQGAARPVTIGPAGARLLRSAAQVPHTKITLRAKAKR